METVIGISAALMTIATGIFFFYKMKKEVKPTAIDVHTEIGKDGNLCLAFKLCAGARAIHIKRIEAPGHKVAFAWSKECLVSRYRMHLWEPSAEFSEFLSEDIVLRPSDEPVEFLLLISNTTSSSLEISFRSWSHSLSINLY